MGIPVITLRGKHHAGRVGASILQHVGRPDFIAENEDEYVEMAVSLAGDSERLIDLRKTLRPQMLDSPLMNIELFTQSMEDAYREMWVTWCEKT